MPVSSQAQAMKIPILSPLIFWKKVNKKTTKRQKIEVLQYKILFLCFSHVSQVHQQEKIFSGRSGKCKLFHDV
jgi:hypothetical protein